MTITALSEYKDDLTVNTALDIDSSIVNIQSNSCIVNTSQDNEFISQTPMTPQQTTPREKQILLECATSPRFKEDQKLKQLQTYTQLSQIKKNTTFAFCSNTVTSHTMVSREMITAEQVEEEFFSR